MTKNVLADWSHLDLALNPTISRYAGRKLVVEFDLYGEWSGRGDLPVCYPEYIWRHIREIKALGAIGAMGRLIHDERSQSELPFPTVFDSPMGVNVYAFSKALAEPLTWLGETDLKWHDNIEAIDKSFWAQWTKQRYGQDASVALARALGRTSAINNFTFDLAGVGFRSYICYPTFSRVKPGDPTTSGYSWRNFNARLDAVGIEYLRDEKIQAMTLLELTRQNIGSVKHALSDSDYLQLQRAFGGARLIVQAYQLALEAYYQRNLLETTPQSGDVAAVSRRLRVLAETIDRERGAKWYFDLAGRDVPGVVKRAGWMAV
jgi:hypothetical protein